MDDLDDQRHFQIVDVLTPSCAEHVVVTENLVRDDEMLRVGEPICLSSPCGG
jgi:hypothetical protein